MNIRKQCNAPRVLMTSLLAASVAAASGMAMAQEISTDRADDKQSAQPLSDTWITTKVKTELLASKDVPGMDVSVETVNGVVTLSGHLDSQAEIERAVAVAAAVDGVTRVDSTGLKVKPGQ